MSFAMVVALAGCGGSAVTAPRSSRAVPTTSSSVPCVPLPPETIPPSLLPTNLTTIPRATASPTLPTPTFPPVTAAESGLTKQQILTTPDEELPTLVWGYTTGFDLDAHPVWKTFWMVEELNYEVGNGGFVQYFENTNGGHVADADAALAAMGASKHLGVFREAVRRWRRERQAIDRIRTAEMKGWDCAQATDSLTVGQLDDRWSPIEPIESAYIRAHLDAFASR